MRERCKRCDILVNSGGAARAGNFLDLADAAWLDGYALKLFGCVLFLCSEPARHIQGTAIAVDGGATSGYY